MRKISLILIGALILVLVVNVVFFGYYYPHLQSMKTDEHGCLINWNEKWCEFHSMCLSSDADCPIINVFYMEDNYWGNNLPLKKSEVRISDTEVSVPTMDFWIKFGNDTTNVKQRTECDITLDGKRNRAFLNPDPLYADRDNILVLVEEQTGLKISISFTTTYAQNKSQIVLNTGSPNEVNRGNSGTSILFAPKGSHGIILYGFNFMDVSDKDFELECTSYIISENPVHSESKTFTLKYNSKA